MNGVKNIAASLLPYIDGVTVADLKTSKTLGRFSIKVIFFLFSTA